MDGPEFLAVVPQIVQEDQHIYGGVTVYGDVEDADYMDYTNTGEASIDPATTEEMLEPNLPVSSNLFEARNEDLLNIKIEHVDVAGGENLAIATDDESMAIEALRQLGNSTYMNKASPRIETTTPDDLPLLPCPTCDLQFRTTADLNSHSEICKHANFVCPICNESFERKLDLNNHLVCHAVDRPHSCRTCGTLFIHKQDLQRHMATHGTTATSQCQVCGQQFTRPSSLTNHMKIHNYQPGRAILSQKITATADLSNILTGNTDPPIEPVQKIVLPSINNITPWNLYYDSESFSSDINLEGVTIGTNADVRSENIKNESVEVEEVKVEVDPKRPYRCDKCGKTFVRQKASISHQKLHEEVLDNLFHCDRCENSFPTLVYLEKHLEYCGMRHIQPKKSIIKLPHIDLQNGTFAEVKCHAVLDGTIFPIEVPDFQLGEKDGEKSNSPYKHNCTECGKGFATKQKLFRHMWIHRKKVYTCELCAQTFDKQELLDAHRLSTHQGSSAYVCPECGKNFSSRQGLWEHNRIHTTETNSFKCTECEKTFTSRQGYLIHKRKHSDERPYGCRFCWKAFRDGGTLRKHERIHTGERPHACPLCNKAFNQKVVLREHIRCLHTALLAPNEGAFFRCPLCTIQIADKDELCAHFVKHSDQMAQLAKDASKNNILAPVKAAVEQTKQVLPVITKVETVPTEVQIGTYVNNAASSPAEVSSVDVSVQTSPGKFKGILIKQNGVLTEVKCECDLCGDIFENKHDLSDHVRVHI